MSRFKVDWVQEAQNELAEIWMRASDRPAVNAAATTIDNLLAADPIKNGTDIAEGLRKLIVPPLMVFFSVRLADRYVEVANAFRYPP
jgi:hypothetical protein